MKKSFALAVLLTGIIFSSSIFCTPAYASSGSKTLKVSVDASRDYNNHVGNEWGKFFEVNGKDVSNGSKVTLKAGDTITVGATIIEYDDSKNDVGYDSVSKTLTQSDIDNGFRLSVDVVVVENGGRYKGNTAGWTISYTFR